MQLGLIGDSIKASRAPYLHRACGHICGLNVTYDLLSPPELGASFGEIFDRCLATLDGFNITMPYKERAVERVRIDAPILARLGAINTVCVTPEGPIGYNTDYTGFIAAYLARFESLRPGRVVVFGAGGVGRAVVFGLVALGASDIAIIDTDVARADRLAAAATDAATGHCLVYRAELDALENADGVVNCTPLGMGTSSTSPVPEDRFPAASWAFDAVYTPAETPFWAQAIGANVPFLSGYELFFQQGIACFELFSGLRIEDHTRLRELLTDAGSGD